MHRRKKSHEYRSLRITFYISVPNFRTSGSIIKCFFFSKSISSIQLHTFKNYIHFFIKCSYVLIASPTSHVPMREAGDLDPRLLNSRADSPVSDCPHLMCRRGHHPPSLLKGALGVISLTTLLICKVTRIFSIILVTLTSAKQRGRRV